MSEKLSKFEIRVTKGGFLNLKQREVMSDTITVPKDDQDTIILNRGVADTTWLCIKHYNDGGARVEVGFYPNFDCLPIDMGVYELRRKTEKFYKMESSSNINFPDSRLETDLEVPTLIGSMKVKIRRVS